MRLDGFEIALLLIFFSKLLWNVIFPAVMELVWSGRMSGKNPRSFNMFIGFEIICLMVFSLWGGYMEGSYIFGLTVVFVGAAFIAISYVLSIFVARFVRNKS